MIEEHAAWVAAQLDAMSRHEVHLADDVEDRQRVIPPAQPGRAPGARLARRRTLPRREPKPLPAARQVPGVQAHHVGNREARLYAALASP